MNGSLWAAGDWRWMKSTTKVLQLVTIPDSFMMAIPLKN